MEKERITVTKLTKTEGGWTANVNGLPVMTLGKSGTMSCWVTKPNRLRKQTREVLPEVRKRLVKKVRETERREAVIV